MKQGHAPTPSAQIHSDTDAFIKKNNDALEAIRLKQAARKKAPASTE